MVSDLWYIYSESLSSSVHIIIHTQSERLYLEFSNQPGKLKLSRCEMAYGFRLPFHKREQDALIRLSSDDEHRRYLIVSITNCTELMLCVMSSLGLDCHGELFC